VTSERRPDPIEATTQELPADDVEFRLDVSLDIERERLLFYRVILVLELLAGALLVRQMLLWNFVG